MSNRERNDGMSNEPKKRSHPIRIAVFMLIGAGFGTLFAPQRINGFNGWGAAAVSFGVVAGALGGLALEFLVRATQRD